MLDGVFADEHGDYPAGTDLSIRTAAATPRVRTPAASCWCACASTPARIGREASWTPTGLWAPGPTPGIEVLPLYAQAGYPERMRLERWTPGAARPRHPDGEERFVLQGTVQDEEGVAGPGYWLRYPAGDVGPLHSATGGRLNVRVGGLRWRG